VDGFAVGDRVLVHSTPLRYQGAWAERFLAPAADVASIPDGLTDDVAAALPIPALTADQTLRGVLELTEGLTLLVHGAGGVTGQMMVQLAVELGARSIDHLEATGEAGVRALAESDVVAVLLPASALFLDRPMPPARALVDAGAAVALATDFNPGSAFCESLPLVCSLASTQLHLSPSEALTACTVNAAYVLGCADRKGRIAPGFDADLVLLDAPDWRHLAYHLGGDLVATVIQGGRVAWTR